MAKQTITQAQLCSEKHPTLEDVLAFVNCGKYVRFFLERPKDRPDGRREFFTRRGAAVYERLIALLYAVDRLVRPDAMHDGRYTMNEIVEKLDEISRDPT